MIAERVRKKQIVSLQKKVKKKKTTTREVQLSVKC